MKNKNLQPQVSGHATPAPHHQRSPNGGIGPSVALLFGWVFAGDDASKVCGK
jgi:hypothetical protein